MVDNENQWEEVEYSEDVEPESYPYDDGPHEYSEQSDDQEYENYEYEEENDENEPLKKKSNPLPMVLIFLILLAVVGCIVFPKMMGNSQTANNAQNNENSVETAQMPADMTDSFFNEAGGDEANNNMSSVSFNENGELNVSDNDSENGQVATVTDVAPNQEGSSNNDLFDSAQDIDISNSQGNNSIMVVYNKASRSNPFKPPVVNTKDEEPYEVIDNTQFEIIEPPVASVPDENLTRLLQTQISGILYDETSPSAIVNLNGKDQFVKAGDTVSGYKIVSITRDKVQISYKNNSYVASVGELFTKGNLEKNPAVANLQNKFGGRYKD